jgi:hypothetical protein
MQIAELQYQLDDSIPVQRILRLKVGATDVCIFMDRAASELRKEVVVPGFRKGKGPLWMVRKQYSKQVGARAFQEIKQASFDQALKLLRDEDQPFLPPENVDGEGSAITYGKPLEFAVRYLIDPSGISKSPEQPTTGFDPLRPADVGRSTPLPMGVPAGPTLPTAKPLLGQRDRPVVSNE